MATYLWHQLTVSVCL